VAVNEAELHPIALFAKPDADRDYEWSSGRDAIPHAFFGLCQYLARTANAKGVVLAAAVSLPEGVYLARSFHQGIDGSYRPSFGLEVGMVRLPRPLEPELLLGIAWAATRKAWAESRSVDKAVRLELPGFEDEPVAADEATALRARLGLPVSAGTLAQARWLLRHCPNRFGGVACAPKLRGDALPWNRELAGLLAVHFGGAELDDGERLLLERVESRPPTEQEWQCLDLLSTSRARGLMSWAAGGGVPFPAPADAAAAAWLATFRRATSKGSRLLAQLRSDLGLTSLPRTVLELACRDLSPAAFEALAAFEAGDGGTVTIDVLGELAAAGFLDEGSPLPPRLWLGAGTFDTAAWLLELLRQERTDEAREVLAAATAGELPRLPGALAAVLAARLNGDPPVEVDSARDLEAFARSGLLRPCDVVPRGELGSILELAALWGETEPLAAMLRGEPRLPPAESCPAGWRAPLKQVLSHGRAAAWLAGWQGHDLPAARLWLCGVLDLPEPVRCLAGEPERGEAPRGVVISQLDWLATLWRSDAVARRLELISRLAERDWLAGQDRLAARFAAALLPGTEAELRELCVHVLTRRGPLPAVGRIAPDRLAALLPAIDPLPLLDLLFASRGPSPAADPSLLDALVERVRLSGVTCPPHGYTAAQLERQAPLAHRLARLPGWKGCAIDLETRRQIARDVLRDLDLACSQFGGAEPERAAAAADAGAPRSEEDYRP
jgi:hypothetical protein